MKTKKGAGLQLVGALFVSTVRMNDEKKFSKDCLLTNNLS